MVISIDKDSKVNRVLTIYIRLVQGENINKNEVADIFGVSKKTIQRDLEDIRYYFYNNKAVFGEKDIIYDRYKNGYYLDNRDDVLTREDVLAIIKILLESRAFCKKELTHLIESVLGQVDNKQANKIKEIIGNELINYVPMKHDSLLLSKLWDLSELIRKKEITQITYIKVNGEEVQRKIEPISIIFSEYYFYLIAYVKDYDSPTVFRVDRIKNYESLAEKFYIPEAKIFKEGEFRGRIQFMYPGKLIKIKFKFWGSSIDAVLERLPTAKIIDEYDNKYLVEAEVFGKGIIMWILSQMQFLEVIEPEELREEVIDIISKMINNYK